MDDAAKLATDDATEDATDDRILEATELDERLKRARGEAASRPTEDGNRDSVSKQRAMPAKKYGVRVECIYAL